MTDAWGSSPSDAELPYRTLAESLLKPGSLEGPARGESLTSYRARQIGSTISDAVSQVPYFLPYVGEGLMARDAYNIAPSSSDQSVTDDPRLAVSQVPAAVRDPSIPVTDPRQLIYKPSNDVQDKISRDNIHSAQIEDARQRYQLDHPHVNLFPDHPQSAETQNDDWVGKGVQGLGASALAGIIAGPFSRTANLSKLYSARELAASGRGDEEIWNKTGWFMGPDQKWRYEIPDNKLDLRKITPDVSGRDDHYHFAGFTHPDLKRAYDMKELIWGDYGRQSPGGGSYGRPWAHDITDPDELARIRKQIGSESLKAGQRGSIRASGRSDDQAKSTLIHELQHGVQERENFARGGNPEQWTPADIKTEQQRLYDEYVNHPDTLKYAYPGWHLNYPEITPQTLNPSQELRDKMYRRLAGEVESRNVENRMNYSPEWRQRHPPWLTQSIPFEDQIVKMYPSRINPDANHADELAQSLMRPALPQTQGGSSLLQLAKALVQGGPK